MCHSRFDIAQQRYVPGRQTVVNAQAGLARRTVGQGTLGRWKAEMSFSILAFASAGTRGLVWGRHVQYSMANRVDKLHRKHRSLFVRIRRCLCVDSARPFHLKHVLKLRSRASNSYRQLYSNSSSSDICRRSRLPYLIERGNQGTQPADSATIPSFLSGPRACP